MIYRDFKGIKLSALGLGMMRLPTVDGNDKIVDEQKAQEMVDYAYENGLNYFDTAWMYHGGNSENITGKLLSKYPRDTYYLASKFPGFGEDNFRRKEEIFEEQLRRCNTEYFDFYLFHNIDDGNVDNYLNKDFGLFEYLMEQKKNGRIKHLGFSTHGSCAVIERVINEYGADIEFCQLQFNYMDWHFQNCEEKYNLLKKAGVPVWVMEPVRGGRLAQVSDEMQDIMKKMRPDESVPGWSFRFLQSFDGVGVVLSGMSNMEQLKENIETYAEDKPLTEEEMNCLVSQMDEECKKGEIPCTSCRYCTAYCPKNIDIPEIFKEYNESIKNGEAANIKTTAECIGCKSCEKVCPQCIRISELIREN